MVKQREEENAAQEDLFETIRKNIDLLIKNDLKPKPEQGLWFLYRIQKEMKPLDTQQKLKMKQLYATYFPSQQRFYITLPEFGEEFNLNGTGHTLSLRN